MTVLAGKRVLVVEDDWIVADAVERALLREGAEVIGPAPTLDLCLSLIAAEAALDGAVLDVNLRGVWVYPAIDALKARGVPHVFLTGYESWSIPAAFADVRRFEKPMDPRRVVRALFRDGPVVMAASGARSGHPAPGC